jgi:hypothetical protein
MKTLKQRYDDATGAIGYILLWLMGVPATCLLSLS